MPTVGRTAKTQSQNLRQYKHLCSRGSYPRQDRERNRAADARWPLWSCPDQACYSVSLGGGVGRGLGVAWDLGVGVGLGVAVGLVDAVGVGVEVGVAVAVVVGVDVGVEVVAAVAVGVGVAVGVEVAVGVGDAVGVGVGVPAGTRKA
jgi:hypothetical protein